MRVYMCVCLQCAGMQKYLETQRLDEVWALGRSDGARAEHVEARDGDAAVVVLERAAQVHVADGPAHRLRAALSFSAEGVRKQKLAGGESWRTTRAAMQRPSRGDTSTREEITSLVIVCVRKAFAAEASGLKVRRALSFNAHKLNAHTLKPPAVPALITRSGLTACTAAMVVSAAHTVPTESTPETTSLPLHTTVSLQPSCTPEYDTAGSGAPTLYAVRSTHQCCLSDMDPSPTPSPLTGALSHWSSLTSSPRGIWAVTRGIHPSVEGKSRAPSCSA
jgi:hypothetical protein